MQLQPAVQPPPRILLVTVGSLGDLHPFMALGLALRRGGAQVVLASAEEYRPKVERAGLEFRPVRPSFEDMQRTLGLDRSQLTRLVLERSDFLLRRLIMPHLEVSFDDILPLVREADLVLTSSLAFGARLAAEKSAVPWIAVVLQPLMFLSSFDPPVIPNAAWLTWILRRLGPSVTRGALALLKRALGAQLGPVRRLRARIGLAPTHRNPLFEGQFSPLGAIGLYSPTLGAARADYPQPTCIPGFACFDSEDGAPAALDPALRCFLEAGARPLVFTLGSLIVNSPGSFFRDSLAAARLLGRRVVLLMGDGAGDAAKLCGPGVHVSGYAPHSLLFPLAEVVVHQGGVGTLAQALRSGRPQLIVPFYADQSDNAARAVRLGVARATAPGRYAASAVRHLDALLSEPQYAARARRVQEQVRAEDGAALAARWALNALESRRSRSAP